MTVALLGVLARADGAAGPSDAGSWQIRDADLYGTASHGGLVWAVGYWGLVRRSDDGGASWSVVAAPARETLFDVAFADRRHGWAVGENGVVLRSVDGGLTWTRQPVTLADESGGREDLGYHTSGCPPSRRGRPGLSATSGSCFASATGSTGSGSMSPWRSSLTTRLRIAS